MLKIEAKQFLEQSEVLSVIDVRSPKEFESGHIWGAVNMPIFDNDERAVVGTLYKKQSKEAAVLKGLEIVGPKMAGFAQQALKLAHDKKIMIHCWRGGMRSESMAWLFEKVGLEVFLLTGGYKAYRSYCLSQMDEMSALTVLKGTTGSGKTEILYELEKRGEQMLDLEGLAHHRGSSFGGIGQLPQPSTEQFQNDLYHAMASLDLNQRIWVEGESKSIGRVNICDVFWSKMQNAQVVHINVPFESRVQRLVVEYALLDADEMEAAILRLNKRLGGERTKNVLEIFREKNYADTARLLLGYYDKGYQFSDKNYTQNIECLEVQDGDAKRNAELLIKLVQ